MHLFCLCDELVSKVRVSDRNNRLCSLPCGKPLQIDHTVLGYNILRIGTGVSHDRALCQSWANTGMHLPLLICEGGRAADKALAALGQVCAKNEVELTTGSADLFDS